MTFPRLADLAASLPTLDQMTEVQLVAVYFGFMAVVVALAIVALLLWDLRERRAERESRQQRLLWAAAQRDFSERQDRRIHAAVSPFAKRYYTGDK